MVNPEDQKRFEALVLPHLDAAHNLARWLVRRDAEAQDLAQEAVLRAYRFFGTFRGGDPRAWLLKIVRNTCYTWLASTDGPQQDEEFDEAHHAVAAETPESLAIAGAERERLGARPRGVAIPVEGSARAPGASKAVPTRR